MKIFVPSATALALVLAIGAGSASACEWMKNQVTAQASPPATGTEQTATKVDPRLLAYLVKKPVGEVETTQVK